MDVQRFIENRRPQATIRVFGEVTEDNDRIALLQVRPGMRESQPAALMLRRWGKGHECRCDGQAWYFDDRAGASFVAERWIAEGRTQTQGGHHG